MSIHSPSFERFLTAIARREPDRVPLAEVWVDPEIKQAFLGRPVCNLQDDLAFWLEAGYGFIPLDTDLYASQQVQMGIVVPHENTATLYEARRSQRNWVSSGAGMICNQEDIERFPWPEAEGMDYSAFTEIQELLPLGMKVIVSFGHIFTMAWQLMGFERFCTTLLDDLSLIQDIISRVGVETLRLMEKVLSFPCVGALWFQDDIAYTNGPMVSPQLLRQIFFPWLARAADLAHDAGRPLLFHSDGNLEPVLPDIVAAGVDALHPIEPKCMDIVALKHAYGDRLTLIGNLDLGYTLTRGTPDEVRQAVFHLIKNVAPGGGFLLGSANSVTNYVPLENYLAMLEAAFEYGHYPITL